MQISEIQNLNLDSTTMITEDPPDLQIQFDCCSRKEKCQIWAEDEYYTVDPVDAIQRVLSSQY